MHKIALTEFLLLILSLNIFSQAGWTRMADYPGKGQSGVASFAIGHYGFIGLGQNSTGTYEYDFWKWNQRNNTWTQIANYPGAGSYASTPFVIEGKGYIAFGESISQIVHNDLWSYDTATNKWTQVASIPGPARYDCNVFVMGHKAYILAGSTGGPPYLEDIWVYNAHQNSWKQLNNFPEGDMEGILGFSIGNYGYGGCGWDGNTNHNTMYKYDTTNDTWTQIAYLPVYGTGLGGNPRTAVIGSEAYVFNGNDGLGMMPNGLVYDTVTKAWCEFSKLDGIDRGYCAAFQIEGKLYMGAGIDSLDNYLHDFRQYYPVSTFTVQDTSQYCSSDSVEFFGLSTYDSSSYAFWDWSFPGGSPSTSFLQNPIVYYSSPGNYPVTLFVSSCAGTETVQRTINVSMLPTEISGFDSICKGDSITLTATPGIFYVWSTGASTSSITVSPASTTTYSVTVIYQKSCQKNAGKTVKVDSCIYLGNNQLKMDNRNWAIYPNPGKGIFIFQSAACNTPATNDSLPYGSQKSESSEGTIEIYNVFGEKVYSAVYHSSPFIINLNEPDGVYFLILTSADGGSLGQGKVVIAR